jgi:hypothetical protein
MLYPAVSSMRDVSTNHRNNRTISRTLRRYLDPGFAKGFSRLRLRSGLAVRNIAWSPITSMLSTGFEVRSKLSESTSRLDHSAGLSPSSSIASDQLKPSYQIGV